MLAPILVTDHDWFEYLQAHAPFDEVNFLGYGLFARHKLVPAWLAWEAFGTRTGRLTFPECWTGSRS